MCGDSESKRSDRDKDGYDRRLSLDCTGCCRPLTNPSFVLKSEKELHSHYICVLSQSRIHSQRISLNVGPSLYQILHCPSESWLHQSFTSCIRSVPSESLTMHCPPSVVQQRHKMPHVPLFVCFSSYIIQEVSFHETNVHVYTQFTQNQAWSDLISLKVLW